MSEISADYRRYLDPRTLARVGSLELRARLIVEGLMAGMHRSPYQGISIEFAQHRPYVSGDDTRHVDWKVFGKTNKIYLKQYLQETNLQLVCVVDASQSMSFGSIKVGKGDRGRPTVWTKYDHATALAAALAYLSIHQQDAVGLAVFDAVLGRYFKPSNSPGQWKVLINELRQVPRNNKTNTGRVLEQLAEKLAHRSLVVIISDLLDDLDGIAKGLRRLRYKKHEVIVMQVLDPQEIAFNFTDITLFKGLEELGQVLTEPEALRGAYLQELAKFTDELKRICRGMNIDYQRFSSGDALDVALSEFLARREESRA
jgi:uncharacterized protein (DUF58 family)